MAEPIDFQIIENLQAALQGISIAGGYFHDVQAVAVKLDIDAKVEDIIGSMGNARPFVVLEKQQDRYEYFPASQMRYRLPFTVHFVNDIVPTSDPAMLQEFMRMCADVEQAIAVDYTRGALASDTIMLDREKRAYDGTLTWAMINIEVRGNRTYGQPNS